MFKVMISLAFVFKVTILSSDFCPIWPSSVFKVMISLALANKVTVFVQFGHKV